MERDEILKRLRKIDVLPTFPAVVSDVVGIMEDPMSSAADLAKNMDPSMTSEVLRVANTAYFGTRSFRKITSVEHAIAILGLEQISQIILHMPFLSMMEGEDGPGREGFIRHSMVCGVLSRVAGRTLHVGDEQAVYIGGLMHDIGAIVIYRYFNDEWKTINAMMSEGNIDRVRAEEEVLSCDHGMVGGCLLSMWNIPEEVSRAVMYHHRPQMAGENIWNIKIVDLGNRFAKRIDLSDNFENFDEFINNNREFVSMVEGLGIDVSLSQELDLFEGSYGMLRNVKGLLGATGEKPNDQSACCR